MIESYHTAPDGGLARSEGLDPEALWIDMSDPAPADLDRVSEAIGITLPSRADMEEIELSSRLYRRGAVDYMTLVLPALADTEDHEVAPVTFVLSEARLVTIRYHTPRPFRSYPDRAERSPYDTDSAREVLFGLLDEIIDRLADILELTDSRIEKGSRGLFRMGGGETEVHDLRSALSMLGQAGALVSDVRNSLVTIERALGFIDRRATRKEDGHSRRAIELLSSDVSSLSEHASFLTQKLSLILDTVFGLTTIEQNATTKTFSLVAVLFLPPTLIGAIFGMNFALMPWIDWRWGFAAALAAMALSSLLSYLYFRWKNLL